MVIDDGLMRRWRWLYLLLLPAGMAAWHFLSPPLGLERYWIKGLWLVLILWTVPWLFTASFYRRFVGPATPGVLGAIRALLCFIMCLWVAREDFGASAMLPREMFHAYSRDNHGPGMGYLSFVYTLPTGYRQLLDSVTGMRVLQGVVYALLVAGAVGWRSRVTLPLATFGCLLLGATLRGYSFFWHQGLVPCYALIALCFMASGDGWSLDYYRRRRRGKPVADPDVPTAYYGWCRYSLWTIVAATYALAAFSKLRMGGFWWWWPDNMRRMVMVDSLNAMDWDFKVAQWMNLWPDAFWGWLGICGVFGELVFAVVLLWRWGRYVMPMAMLGMHVGILFLQKILFLDLIFIQAIFYDWKGLVIAWRRWKERCVEQGLPRPSWFATARGMFKGMAQADDRGVAAPPAGRWTRVLGPAGLAFAFVFLCLVWMQYVEKYPLTGMRMFNRYEVPEYIHYFTTRVTYTDGREERLNFGDWNATLGQARFRPWLARAFQAKEQGTVDDFIGAVIEDENARWGPQRQVAKVEIIQHRWRYILDRDDPQYGEEVRRYVYTVGQDPPSRIIETLGFLPGQDEARDNSMQ